jgi:hypothetical protein
MEINKKIEEKYEEMKKSGKTEDFLDKDHFGELKLFIQTKPKEVLFFLELDSNTVYLGSN